MPDDDAVLKRLELYFEGRQANLAIFSATLQMTIMRREDILDELENTLQRAKDLACRKNEPPLADLPALKDEPGVSISPAGPDADDRSWSPFDGELLRLKQGKVAHSAVARPLFLAPAPNRGAALADSM
jgi:hypothetical protein